MRLRNTDKKNTCRKTDETKRPPRRAAKQNAVRTTALLCSAAMFCACTACEIKRSPVAELKILVSNELASVIERPVAAYNAAQDDCRIEIKTCGSYEVMLYKFSCGVETADLVVFENHNDADDVSDRLTDVSDYEIAGDIQISILKSVASDDGTFVFPTVGSACNLCYNMYLMNRYNYSLPQTLDEYMALAKKVKANAKIAGCASLGGTGAMSLSLLEIAVPLFLSTTRGVTFLREYYEGKTTLTGGEFADKWKEIFDFYRTLYRLNYFKSDEISSDETSGFNSFAAGENLSLRKSPAAVSDTELERRNVDFDYVYYPFVGNVPENKWIASRPLYYYSVSRESGGNLSKRRKIESFFDWLTSEDGVNASLSDDKGERIASLMTYVSDAGFYTEGAYSYFKDVYAQNKIYLLDTFESVFDTEEVAAPLYRFVTEEIDSENLMRDVDAAAAKRRAASQLRYDVPGDFDYGYVKAGETSVPSPRVKETAIGDFAADAVRKTLGSSFAVLPASAVKGNLYGGSIRLDQLSVVFRDLTLSEYYLDGKTIVSLVETMLDRRWSEDFPLISGLRIGSSPSGRTITASDGRALQPDSYYRIVLEADSVAATVAERTAAGGSLTECIRQYAELYGIPAPYTDGRYGVNL